MDIFNTFETLAKAFRKTPVGYPDGKIPDPYKICTIHCDHKATIRVLNDENVLEEEPKLLTFNAYGYEPLLEYINAENLRVFKNAIQNLMPEETQVLNLFQSDIF